MCNSLSSRVNDSKVQKNREAGFNLVELMVVVTIIGILAAVAVPRFRTFQARAQQTEAKSGLNGLYLSMQAYLANYGAYPTLAAQDALGAGATIGFSVGGSRRNYDYYVVSDLATNSWAGMASSRTQINATVDHLRINTNKWQCSPFDAISGMAATATPAVQNQANPTDCPQAFNRPTARQAPALVAADNAL